MARYRYAGKDKKKRYRTVIVAKPWNPVPVLQELQLKIFRKLEFMYGTSYYQNVAKQTDTFFH
jgi:hypothetical protein